MFKGTESRDGEEIDRSFDTLGVHHNAWTSHEITAFHVHSLPDALSPALEILADIMRPALRSDDIADEAEVVVEEIAMYEDQPFWQLWEAASAAYFGEHPMGHRVLGTKETVRAINRDVMQNWHRSRFGADNIVLSLAGDIDFDSIAESVQVRGAATGRQQVPTAVATGWLIPNKIFPNTVTEFKRPMCSVSHQPRRSKMLVVMRPGFWPGFLGEGMALDCTGRSLIQAMPKRPTVSMRRTIGADSSCRGRSVRRIRPMPSSR